MKKIFFIIFIIYLLIIFSAALYSENIYFSIHFLNAGEGEVTLIKTQDKKILIDASNPMESVRIYKYLKKLDIKKLDYLIISHPHPDHFGGIFTLVDLVEVKNIVHNGEDITSLVNNDFYRWYQDILDKSDAKVFRAGDKIKISKDVILQTVWSSRGSNYSINDNSLAFLLTYKNFIALFSGDLTRNIEDQFLSILSKKGIKKLDLYKSSHHGAKDTLGKRFLKKFSPTNIVVCIDKDNIRGYPDKKIVELYKKESNLLINYKNGNIIFEVFSDGNYRIKTTKTDN